MFGRKPDSPVLQAKIFELDSSDAFPHSRRETVLAVGASILILVGITAGAVIATGLMTQELATVAHAVSAE